MRDQTYLERLPRKLMSAGCLLRDCEGRILLVKPTYKAGWEIPGGIAEANESPRQTCAREVREELGLELGIGRLLCLDYTSVTPESGEGLHFIFDGGVLSEAELTRIRLPADELSTYGFVKPEEALSLLSPRLGRRARRAMEALSSGEMPYLEDQELPQT